MHSDEGYIKFRAHWTQRAAFTPEEITLLNTWRQRCYERGWIGAYPDGIGFGNISRRWDASGRFLISGSATGNLPALSAAHYALVEQVLPEQNTLWCSGPVIASSESMSHAAIYSQCPEVSGVIHIHHRGMWELLLKEGIATHPGASYGSPEMVASIVELLQDPSLRARRIFAMAGHEDGVFAFGKTLEEAYAVLESIEID